MAKKNYVNSCSSPDNDEKWQAESDLRLLVNAEEVMSDKKRLAAAKKCAVEQRKSLENLLKGDS